MEVLIKNFDKKDPIDCLREYVLKNIKKCKYDHPYILGENDNRIRLDIFSFHEYNIDRNNYIDQHVKFYLLGVSIEELYKIGLCFSKSSKHKKLSNLYFHAKLTMLAEQIKTIEQNIGITGDLKNIINDFTNLTRN